MFSESTFTANETLGEQHGYALARIECRNKTRIDDLGGVFGLLDAIDDDAHQLQRTLCRQPHGGLPRVELGVFAAHGHDGHEREATAVQQREHVHAVAHPAALHQQNGALAAKPCATDDANALFFGREDDIANLGVGFGTFDDVRVTCVGHISDLLDAALLQCLEDFLMPGQVLRDGVIHGGSVG